MSQGKKRCRKSKLEVRDDDCEYELVTVSEKNETTPHLQKIPKIETKLEFLSLLDHDYCIQEFQTYNLISNASNSTTIPFQYQGSMELSVKVEVEQIDEMEKQIFPENNSLLKKMEDKKFKHRPAILTCNYHPDLLYRVSDDIVSKSSNPADKILDIEMRNLWGNVLNTPNVLSPHETILQMALETWQAWCSGSRTVRECPLFYQCHICYTAWWRLQPFREHLKTHELRTLKVTLKENIHECMIIASKESVSNLIFIDIDEDCWKCGRDVEFHKCGAQGYTCNRCKRTMYTCSLLRDHELTCLYSNIDNFNIAIERQCTICKRFMDSLPDVSKHMLLTHTVRSDIPVPTTFKQCNLCSCKYFKYSLHNCTRSPKNSSCEHCCRKFSMKQLTVAHMLSQYNRSILCRICAKQIKTKCQEMEHLLNEHSNSYQLAYKCTICSNQSVLFVDEISIKLHKQAWHQKKSDKRRSFYELMLVPKYLLEDGCLEEAFENGTESTKQPSPSRKVHRNDDFSIEASSNEFQLGVLTADVDVTVDEIDIKKEPIEYSENGEIDYEEMLHKMFNNSNENKPKSPEKVEITPAEAFQNIQIKTEVMDDLYIIENPVETIKIKSEPEEYENQELESENQIETLTVKVEPDINMDDIKTEDIIIKNEFDIENNDLTAKAIPFDELIKDLKMFKSKDDMDWVSEEVLNPDEMSFDVLNPSGLYKKKKVYACHKCGYTAQHKQYKIHVTSKCRVSPGINESFPCTKCGLTFVMFRNYVLHFDCHGYEVMSCPKCGLKFDTLAKLLPHVQKHMRRSYVGIHVLNSGGEETSRSKRKSKCQVCRIVVRQEDMFKHWEAHLSLKDNSKPEPVREEPPELTVDCERVTMNNKTLDPVALRLAIDQLQATSADKECIICYRAFLRRYDVKRHIVEHLLMDAHISKFKNKGFRCQICSSSFQGQEQYKFHMREHGSMPIFKCELCDKTFSDSSNFAKHKKTHNVRVLVCDLCGKKFHARAALARHIAEHSRVGHMQCPQCDATFVSKQAYKRHKYKEHVKNKYKCVLCDVSFQTLQKKWDHDWEIHKERKQKADCPICFKSFRKFQDVRIHARSEHNAEVHQLKQARPADMQAYRVKQLGREQ